MFPSSLLSQPFLRRARRYGADSFGQNVGLEHHHVCIGALTVQTSNNRAQVRKPIQIAKPRRTTPLFAWLAGTPDQA